MRVASQKFRGIEYVQISSLPADQKKQIWQSINHQQIIMILKEDSLLNDCLQYRHYTDWYENVFARPAHETAPTEMGNFVLAFK